MKGEGGRDAVGGFVKEKSSSSLEDLSQAWRREYMRTYLPGYLFREQVPFCPYDDDPQENVETVTAVDQPSNALPEGEVNCRRLCQRGERYLAAGYLPEALGEYKTAVEQGCPYTLEGCRPKVGMLKVELAMGRFSEARRLFYQLSRIHEAEKEELFILIDGIFAAFGQDFGLALERFTEAGTEWHLCPNLEGIAGYTLFVARRYEDARNVFRVAMHSRWATVRDFGVLGLADCYLALEQWEEAEPLYESLRKTGSPIGYLSLAEFRVRQGKLKEARVELEKLIASTNQDAWKGVGLAYLISLRSGPEEWAEALHLAERAKALVLSAHWTNELREKTVEALEGGIRSLWEADAHEKLLILAEKWRSCQEDLPESAQLLIGKAYEEARLHGSALEVYSRLSSVPDALFQGARLAWRCEKYEEAKALLETYLESNNRAQRNEAKLLLACVHARCNRLELAKECLRGVSKTQDPSLLIALGGVEASMGMLDLAIEHLQTALEEAKISVTERQHLLYILAELNYQRGRFNEALRYFQLAKVGEGAGEGVPTGPMEILCLTRLDKISQARAQLQKLPKGQDADLVKEILDAEDTIRRLNRNGHAF